MESVWVPVAGGHRVAVDRLHGRRPPLVFLHGLASTRAGVKSDELLRRAGEQDREFWRFDFRAHGESPGALEELTLTGLLADTRAVLERAGRSVLIGSSLGGLVAAWAAARRPELVVGLVLVAPAFGFADRVGDLPAGRDYVLERDEGDVRLLASSVRDFLSYDEDRLAEELRVPVRWVHGARDAVIPARVAERLFARLAEPDKELWIVPDGDHSLETALPWIWDRALELARRESSRERK